MNSTDGLKVGDVLRNKGDHSRYLICGIRAGSVLALSEVYINNPPEWELVVPSNEETRQRAGMIKRAFS